MKTATRLRNVPEIITREFRNGFIKNEKAIVTIGLNHIPEIINFVMEKRITIDCPLYTSLKYGNYSG